MKMARITYRYKQYPLSKELTKKSENVASLTHPLFGFGLGIVLSFALAMGLDVSSDAFNVLMVIGMVGGPIALWIFRMKKFAQYDAEYAKILKEHEKKNAPQNASAVNRNTQASQPKPQPQQPVYQPPVQQQPAYQQPVYQQPVYQAPVQQSAYQPPVMQQPAQPTYQPPVYQVQKTLDEQINEIAEIANRNLDGKNDPEIHWQCASRFEELFRAYPENDRVRRNLAQNLANYAWCSPGRPFQERQRACAAVLRAMAIVNQDPGVAERDRRKYTMIIHAVHGSVDAGNMHSIPEMEEAAQWLRTASEYKLENPDAKQQQYMNVAIPSARFFLGYWLGRAYLEQNPPQKQKARAILEEALQACPFAMIRQCDLNPNLVADTSKIISREDLMELLNRASQLELLNRT